MQTISVAHYVPGDNAIISADSSQDASYNFILYFEKTGISFGSFKCLCPWWLNTGFVFYFLYNKQYHEALQWTEKMEMPDSFWDPLLKAAVLGHLDQFGEASIQMDKLLKMMPGAPRHVKNILETFLVSKELNNEILAGLGKAGLFELKPIIIKR